VERIGGKNRVGDLVCELTATSSTADSTSSRISCRPRAPPSLLFRRNFR
jgi:hypothetical protein